jgi:hypothetical protein
MDSRERAALDRYITRDDDSAEEEELTPGEAAEKERKAREGFALAMSDAILCGAYTIAIAEAENDLLRAARAYVADAARFGPGDFKSAIALRAALEAYDRADAAGTAAANKGDARRKSENPNPDDVPF